jgi:hypothetical protein
MAKTFEGFFKEKYGARRAVSVCDVGDEAHMALCQAFGADLVAACAKAPDTWEAVLVAGVGLDAVEAECDQFFRGIGMAPGQALRGARARTKVYGPADLADDVCGYRCTLVDIFGSVCISSRIVEIKIMGS